MARLAGNKGKVHRDLLGDFMTVFGLAIVMFWLVLAPLLFR